MKPRKQCDVVERRVL